MAADEGSGMEEKNSATELAALAERVAQLERQVAELAGAKPREAEAGAVTIRPVARPTDKAWRPPTLPESIMPSIPPRTPPPPPPPMAQMQAQMHEQAATQSFENRLGSQIFNMVGMVAIIIGASWFLKLAIDRGWVGPVARVLIGLAGGAGLVVWSEHFRSKGFKAFSYSLKAVGSAVLYLSLWAAFHLYHLLPDSVALLAMVLVTGWNGFMAWSQDAELLAGYGLIGGFATPLLLSTGGNHETFLFTYIAAIDLATVLLMRWKPWRRLLLPAFGATVAYFIGWCVEFFHRVSTNEWHPPVWDSQSTETALFALVFFALFAMVSVKGFSTIGGDRADVVVPVLVPLANAAFVGLALYSVMQDSGLHSSQAWLMVTLAALYLGLARVQATPVASAMHLTSAIVFLTIAIPLKASGHTLTTAWLVEGLVLYWAATRIEAESGTPSQVLAVLSLGGYALGLGSLAMHWFSLERNAGFFNANLGAAVVAIGALSGAAWLATRLKEGDTATLLAALVAMDLVALLLTLREIAAFDGYASVHSAFANAEFATALVGLAVLAAVSWAGYGLGQLEGAVFASASAIAGVTLVLFNLLAILSIEREIGALWTRAEAGLQRSLGISAFLMAYGAALLAAGFWRRSSFVRWQGLILLMFTIGKVFFYDMSGLSQGYRVASFMGLGVLLMAVSFAYQKDWLGLRQTEAAASEAGGKQ